MSIPNSLTISSPDPFPHKEVTILKELRRLPAHCQHYASIIEEVQPPRPA